MDEINISYKKYEHSEIFTMEEMMQLDIPDKFLVAKNLFLCDNKKENFYLFTVKGNKKVDLKDLRKQINSKRLSFASKEDLKKYLNLIPGSVSPVGILNDVSKKITMIFDLDLKKDKIIGFHPMENNATVYLAFEDLYKIIQTRGNPIIMVEV